MPKSSSESAMPSSPSAFMISITRTGSAATIVSVISSCSIDGSTSHFSSRALDVAGQAEVEQVRGAEVDGDAERQALVAPAGALGERVVEHAQGQRAHQAGLLGERQERARAEQAELRVLPAHERLGAGDLAGLRGRTWAGSGRRSGRTRSRRAARRSGRGGRASGRRGKRCRPRGRRRGPWPSTWRCRRAASASRRRGRARGTSRCRRWRGRAASGPGSGRAPRSRARAWRRSPRPARRSCRAASARRTRRRRRGPRARRRARRPPAAGRSRAGAGRRPGGRACR